MYKVYVTHFETRPWHKPFVYYAKSRRSVSAALPPGLVSRSGCFASTDCVKTVPSERSLLSKHLMELEWNLTSCMSALGIRLCQHSIRLRWRETVCEGHGIHFAQTGGLFDEGQSPDYQGSLAHPDGVLGLGLLTCFSFWPAAVRCSLYPLLIIHRSLQGLSQVAIVNYGVAYENLASMDLWDGQRQSVSSSVPRSQQVGRKKLMDRSNQNVNDKWR